MLKATILALVVAHAAAYNAAPLVGRGAVRAAPSRRPALAVMHHGVGDHPEPAAPLAAEPAPQQKFRVLPMALGAVAGAIAIKTVLLPTAAVAAGAAATVAPVSLSEVMAKASKRALGGGLSGAIAGVCQVVLLMWLRTTMNYQYRNGGTRKEAMAALYKEGGIGRFYQGLPFAVVQAPLSRFGDTAANTGVLALLGALSSTAGLPIGVRTACASAAASLWRILLTPVDTFKTTLQVEGKEAYSLLINKVKKGGPTVLFQGALGNALASFVGNYPWYLTFNFLQEAIPAVSADQLLLKLMRAALCGFLATCVSDCTSNSIRVLKTTRQTSATEISYREAATQIIEKEGIKGLFGRGLGTRILTNGVQASLFTVIWKYLEEFYFKV